MSDLVRIEPGQLSSSSDIELIQDVSLEKTLFQIYSLNFFDLILYPFYVIKFSREKIQGGAPNVRKITSEKTRTFGASAHIWSIQQFFRTHLEHRKKNGQNQLEILFFYCDWLKKFLIVVCLNEV